MQSYQEQSLSDFLTNDKNIVTFEDTISTQFMWNDFTADSKTSQSLRGKNYYVCGIDDTNNFMTKYNITKIIRGHQDSINIGVIPYIDNNDYEQDAIGGYNMAILNVSNITGDYVIDDRAKIITTSTANTINNIRTLNSQRYKNYSSKVTYVSLRKTNTSTKSKAETKQIVNLQSNHNTFGGAINNNKYYEKYIKYKNKYYELKNNYNNCSLISKSNK